MTIFAKIIIYHCRYFIILPHNSRFRNHGIVEAQKPWEQKCLKYEINDILTEGAAPEDFVAAFSFSASSIKLTP